MMHQEKSVKMSTCSNVRHPTSNWNAFKTFYGAELQLATLETLKKSMGQDMNSGVVINEN